MALLPLSQPLHPWRVTSLTLGLLLGNAVIFAPLAQAGDNWNQFDVCITELKGYGVDDSAAAAGCAEAIIPKEMAQCVGLISRNTAITGPVALQSCFQVRRPVDLGHCVVDINNGLLKGYRSPTSAPKPTTSTDPTKTDGLSDVESGDPTLAALESCRQSLLPGRHSECVIALGRDSKNLSPNQAMTTCLAAEDFPRDLFPAYNQTQTPATTP